MACGETPQEALETVLEIKAAWLEIAEERGWEVPEPQWIGVHSEEKE